MTQEAAEAVEEERAAPPATAAEDDSQTRPPGNGNSPEKFFFDMNVFDENGMELRELEENQPPPLFSEEELETARQTAFAEGKQAGLQEAGASRETHIAGLLEKISRDTTTLFNAEENREKVFETESLQLALRIAKKLFPVCCEKTGLEELKQNLSDLIEKTKGNNQITITVHPENLEGVRAHIESLPEDVKSRLTVQGSENTAPGGCALSWTNGGASRNPRDLADKIVELLEETLAGQGISRHDGEDNEDAMKEDDSTPSQDAAEPEKAEEPPPQEKTDDTQQDGDIDNE